MFADFCEWLQRLAYYLILVTAVLQALPNRSYEKYIRFFCGMVLILLFVEPLLRAEGMWQQFRDDYGQAQERQIRLEMEEAARFLEETEEQEDFAGDEASEGRPEGWSEDE